MLRKKMQNKNKNKEQRPLASIIIHKVDAILNKCIK